MRYHLYLIPETHVLGDAVYFAYDNSLGLQEGDEDVEVVHSANSDP